MTELAIVGGGAVLLGGVIALLLRSVLGLERGIRRLRTHCDQHEKRASDAQEAHRRHQAAAAEAERQDQAERAKIRGQLLKEGHG